LWSCSETERRRYENVDEIEERGGEDNGRIDR